MAAPRAPAVPSSDEDELLDAAVVGTETLLKLEGGSVNADEVELRKDGTHVVKERVEVAVVDGAADEAAALRDFWSAAERQDMSSLASTVI